MSHTHTQQKEWDDGSGFHYRGEKRERLFIPYEGHIPEHAALLPQDTRGDVFVRQLKREEEEKK